MNILVGDIGNTKTKICLVKLKTYKIVKLISFNSNVINSPNSLKKRLATIGNKKNLYRIALFSSVVPKHTLKLVTIDLPNPTIRKVYKGIITGTGSPKAEHMRRGHFRRLPDGRRIWIEQMRVGSKKHGIIEHDYFLRGRNNLKDNI